MGVIMTSQNMNPDKYMDALIEMNRPCNRCGIEKCPEHWVIHHKIKTAVEVMKVWYFSERDGYVRFRLKRAIKKGEEALG